MRIKLLPCAHMRAKLFVLHSASFANSTGSFMDKGRRLVYWTASVLPLPMQLFIPTNSPPPLPLPSILQSPQMSPSIPPSTMSFSQRTLSKHQGHISSPLVSQDPWVLLSQSCRPHYQGIATSRLALRLMLWQRMVHCRLEDTHSILPCCISVGNHGRSVDLALLMSSLDVSISVLSCSVTDFTTVKSWWFH